jgi:hypothetical protein
LEGVRSERLRHKQDRLEGDLAFGGEVDVRERFVPVLGDRLVELLVLLFGDLKPFKIPYFIIKD